ncbi:DUF4348 domain-containing protein [Aquiflexum gelatinilyticum]|uniref:DUF4348 domain-containing protein n=1 Tax=Aquiflexum gelatinilyticum TaxID=2961943 RepID=UPI00216AA14C|nr:DUF4348 domain-containing protein [Aquiflexum gelatinilyticum]MCS4436908.1 DUF4348 domain-containing protein [Aquiflexum gelatinilyticum]
MRLISFISILVFIAGCKWKNETGNTRGLILDSLVNQDSIPNKIDENFEMFISQFNQDSVFQFSRVHFPVTIKSYDTGSFSYVEREMSIDEWDFVKVLEIDDIKHEITPVSSVEVRLEFFKEDTGIGVTYIFKKLLSKWLLVEIVDHSI